MAAFPAADCPISLPATSQPPKDDKKKKDAGKSAKKDKDPVNKSGGKAKKKVGAGKACAAPAEAASLAAGPETRPRLSRSLP